MLSRQGGLSIARVLFVVAALGFAWWGLRDQWHEILAAMSTVTLGQWLTSTVLVLLGLVATGLIWARILGSYGHTVQLTAALSVFFVGQLGKYIPGSVWSLGAQAKLAQRFRVPARTTIATGLVFLYWNVITAVLFGSLATLMNAVDMSSPRAPAWLLGLATVLAVAALSPAVVDALGTRLADSGRPLRTRWRDEALLGVLMAFTWVAYGLAVMVIDPSVRNGEPSVDLWTAVGAFTISYVVGVLVVVAPAGFGAREATLALLLTPSVGVASAAAIAILARVIHTLADFSIAALAWGIGRAGRTPQAA